MFGLLLSLLAFRGHVEPVIALMAMRACSEMRSTGGLGTCGDMLFKEKMMLEHAALSLILIVLINWRQSLRL